MRNFTVYLFTQNSLTLNLVQKLENVFQDLMSFDTDCWENLQKNIMNAGETADRVWHPELLGW